MLSTAFPPWLKKKVIRNDEAKGISELLKECRLNTVCQSARCPNKDECFSKGRATFLILGEVCTRSCRFCSVKKGATEPVDKKEPQRIARFVKDTAVDYVVITSVTRDDLPDGGAAQFAGCIREIRNAKKGVKVEVLTPELEPEHLKKVLQAGPDVFAHNIETVPRLYKTLRPGADYKRSLNFLERARALGGKTAIKSSIMVGLGESEEELFNVMSDLKRAGCSAITIGQYLRPSKEQLEVARFVHPSDFNRFEVKAHSMGFDSVASGPFIRSSYIH